MTFIFCGGCTQVTRDAVTPNVKIMQDPETSFPGETPGVPAMSLGGRLGNIFVSPAEVFDDIKGREPNSANWLVPTVIGIVMGIIFTFVVFSQPGIIQSMRDPTEKRLDKMVADGKITRQLADQQLAIIDKFMSPTFFKVFGTLGALIAQPAMLFLLGLVVWLVGKFALHGDFAYMKSVEAVGLCTMITVPGSIIYMLLVVIYGNMYVTPGPALLLSHFDPTNPLHVLMQSFNLIWVWYLAVLAMALARLSGASFVKAAGWGFGLWAIWLALKLGFVILSAHLGGK
jgi:hypothetical protein